jgi:hypothetical protein
MIRTISVCAAFLLSTTILNDASAERRVSRQITKRSLEQVCPSSKIRTIGSVFFYKNNKPIRDTSRPGAPVIGNNPVMTLAGQPGRGPRLFRGRATLYTSTGTAITSMTPYPCKGDHCSGRVVSSMGTSTARRAIVRATGKATGYIKIDQGVCVVIPDVGRCYGAGVNLGRPLCDRTVG